MNILRIEGLPECHIVNVVATYQLGLCLNVKKISYYNREFPVKFNPSSFAAMTMNVQADGLDPTVVLVFGSGNVVHTGATTEEMSRLSAHTLARFFGRALRIPVNLQEFTITNIVCGVKLGFNVDLSSLAKELGTRAKYRPKKFPACRIRSAKDRKRVGLVYSSGGMVLTGCKTRDDIIELYKTLYQDCIKHKILSADMNTYGETEGRNSTKKKAMKSIKAISGATSGSSLINDDDQSDEENEEDPFKGGIKRATSKHVSKLTRGGRVSTKGGVLYLTPINPSDDIDNENYAPFVPSNQTSKIRQRESADTTTTQTKKKQKIR